MQQILERISHLDLCLFWYYWAGGCVPTSPCLSRLALSFSPLNHLHIVSFYTCRVHRLLLVTSRLWVQYMWYCMDVVVQVPAVTTKWFPPKVWPASVYFQLCLSAYVSPAWSVMLHLLLEISWWVVKDLHVDSLFKFTKLGNTSSLQTIVYSHLCLHKTILWNLLK